jgi:hypothetical protein
MWSSIQAFWSPTSRLDARCFGARGVLRLLEGLRRRANLDNVMITHGLSTAARFADRIVVMYLGRIVEEGPARRRPRSAASVHPGAPVGRPQTRSTGTLGPADPRRRTPESNSRAARLPFPSSLSCGAGAVSHDRTRSLARGALPVTPLPACWSSDPAASAGPLPFDDHSCPGARSTHDDAMPASANAGLIATDGRTSRW